MTRYRKKPIEIEAIQYVGKNFKEICRFLDMTYGDFEKMPEDYDAGPFKIHTLEGDMEVSVGDYIIKDIKGEFYPCKPDIFDETYEEVKE